MLKPIRISLEKLHAIYSLGFKLVLLQEFDKLLLTFSQHEIENRKCMLNVYTQALRRVMADF